ncbi:MAG: hypothetical protein AAGE84_07155 [Cyanobacteria bacterium P01_G01_bin.39]
MNTLFICPCCSSPLLHHVSNHGEYWFCRHCWQEMPDVELKPDKKAHIPHKRSLSREFSNFNQCMLIG